MFVFCSDTWYMYLGFTLVLWTEKKPNIVICASLFARNEQRNEKINNNKSPVVHCMLFCLTV